MALVREMQTQDLARVSAIEKVCFGDRWSLASFQNELANEASSYFVAETPQGLIGYSGYWLILEEAHVTAIAVDPAHQGHGYGELLLISLIEHAADQGAKWVTLEVRASNMSAQRLYAKYGFTSLGRRKGYYQDNQEDALVMWTENIWQAEYRALLVTLRQGLSKRGTNSQAQPHLR